MTTIARTSFISMLLLGGFLCLPLSTAKGATFQQYKAGTCPGNVCFITFANVPAGKQRTARNTSCHVRLANGSYLRYVALQARNASNAVLHSVILEPSGYVLAGNQITYNINDQVLALAPAGGYFGAQMAIFGPATGAILQFDCGISGDQLP